jgi:signal-transduction protein with cAMP-binding, CBS, and nucleotidyltransferase domain
MLEAKVSSLLLLDATGRPEAIFTEHDLLGAIAKGGEAALGETLGRHASRPVESLPADAFVYRALGRMDRLGTRHLAVVDPQDGRAVGVVSARGLLKQRAGRALALGDAIDTAMDGKALASVQAELPALAGALIAEGLDARTVAGLISAVLRDMSARAAELAAAALAAEGRPAPAHWCYLVLGSGGRGESQLVPDQDNALVHDGAETDDPWFAELGSRASDILAAAGVPYCKGKVMASNPGWRGNLDQWRRRIDGWVESPSPEDLLWVDIFYDFQPVFG